MDLMQQYEDIMLGSHIWCSDLRCGDRVHVIVVPNTFLAHFGITSGRHIVSYVEQRDPSSMGEKCRQTCTTNGCCIYLKTSDGVKCVCGSYVYDAPGLRFRDDFEFYREFPCYIKE